MSTLAPTAEEFIKQRYPPKEMLIENLLHRRDLVALGARHRNGKTSFVTSLAIALATGAPEFLGFAIPETRRTLLVLLEDDPGDYQDKLLTAIDSLDLDGNLMILTRDFLEEQDIRIDVKSDQFKECIRENAMAHGSDVVVLDNLGQFVGAEYNDTTQIHSAVKFAYGIARDANAAVIIPSHPRKNGSGEKKLELSAATKTEFFESLMGSSHFINSTGNLWALERNDEHDRITFVGGRQRSEGGDRTLYIQYEGGGHFSVLDDAEANRDNVLNTVKRREAWDLLPKSFTAAEAEKAVKSVMNSKASVNDWLKALKQARLIAPSGIQVAGRGTRYSKEVNS